MSSLKPFMINQTDIQFLIDQINFRPLFDSDGNIIVAWDGTGTVYDQKRQVIGTGGVVAGDAASVAALAAYGHSYQNFTDLAGTRDVSGYWNNLAPLLAHYGDTGQIFPRMMTADYSGYIAQMTGNATTGPILVAATDRSAVTTQANIQTLFDSGDYFVLSAPGVTKMLHEIIRTGTSITTAISEVVSTQVLDGHHLAPTTTTTITDAVTTTSRFDYLSDETTTTLTTALGTNVTTSSNVVQTSETQVTTDTVTGQTVTTLSGAELDGRYHRFSTDYALSHQDYTVQAALGGGAEGDTTSTDGTAINIRNVVDYTPRMISRTTTTASVVYDTWANHASENALRADGRPMHTPNEIYYDPQTGEARVLDWGLLETVANGGEGQIDTQARLEASAGQNDHFIGSLNPGVSPSNGFFVLFGQFFDHGLDFIDKGQQSGTGGNVTIKIALGIDDPLYGMLGPDGQPVTEITINRATVETIDANGSEYVNHVSPFIDQSQTYGSDGQRTDLLREWVSTDGGANYHAGMRLLDGNTLANAWARPDGTMTNETLPTLNELRTHIDATGRDALTWDDIGNLRNRDDAGHVVAGTSGEAILLDMNPRFDTAHLLNAQGETSAEAQKVLDAITYLNSFGVRPSMPDGQGGMTDPDTFGFNADGVLTLHLGSALQMGPGQPPIPAGTDLTGASALAGWVNFADFSIMQTPPGIPSTFVEGVRGAVSDLLLASVGDHYIAGDGRANENFGLTSIHHVFHEEHNYQVQNLINALHTQDVATHDAAHAKLHEFQIDTGVMNGAGDFIYQDGSIAWNEEKVFLGAKLIVEMEYQHAAVDQYARNVSPNIQEFVGYSPDKQPDVTLEYSQVAFRFGHSTLRETIDSIDPDHGITGKIMGYALHDAFLSPEMYGQVGPGAILLGMTHQQQNEVDEFVTPALNQGLLGQPLDLAAINIARGRDVGMPTLNDFREALGLVRYTSWNDFGQNMQHPSSLVNFIAAYAFDGAIDKAQAVLDLAANAFADDAAGAVLGSILGWTGGVAELVSRAYAFLSGDETAGGAGTLAFDQIDTWLGGLAEVHQPGGLLGETFDKVFVAQIESLMDGDRFYYLYRLAGQQFGEEVANGQLKDLVERNTGLVHLNGNVFGYADQYVDLGAKKEVLAEGQTEYQTTGNDHKYGDIDAVAAGTIGIYSNGGVSNGHDGQMITINGRTYVQDTRLSADNPMSAEYNGGDNAFALNDYVNLDGSPNSGAESSEVIVASAGNDMIYAQGGDDTVYGEDGDDIIYGGFGIDRLYGGAGSDTFYGGDNPDLIDGGSGDDFIYGESSGSDINGADQLIGGSGNDLLDGGTGIDKLSAGSGDDRVYGGQDTDPFTHGGDGNDYVDGGSGGDILYGDNGDDIVVGGADQDQLFGNDGDDILRPGDPTGALTIGSDEVLGGDGVDVNDKGFDLIDFSDNNLRPGGVTFDLGNQANPAVTVNGSPFQVPSFQIDGVVGSVSGDTLLGDDETAAGNGSDASIAGDNWLIGGSGNDTFQGLGGNDIIVGGSIRLDALIGRYNSGYTHNNANAGLTEEEQLQDALYQGASHRVLYSEVIDNSGLLGHAQTAMFDRHFTEMLRTEMFQDTMLGDGGTDGTQDTAIYTGTIDLDNPQRSDYTVVALDAQGNVVANPHRDGFFALKITDHRAAADFVDANGNPLLDANGNPLTNEGTDLVVGVENLRFANGTIKTAALFDRAPTLDLNYAPVENLSTVASDNFSGFGGSPYARGTGWAGAWTETADGQNASNNGQIQASNTGGGFGNTGLVFGNGDGASITRTVSALAGQTKSTLSFTYNENGFDNGETVEVRFAADGTNFVTIGTLGGSSGNGTFTADLSALLGAGQTFSSTAALQFVASADAGNGEYVRIDNITLSAPNGTFHDGVPGTGNAIAYTENAPGVAIATTPLIGDPDDNLMASATIHIRDAVAGDRLTVGALNAGIVATGTGTGTVMLTGLASFAAYQDAIAAITFDSTSDDPTAADRHIDVTVNDGLRDSAVATTTVAVTPVDDPTTATAPDAIITNYGTGNNNTFSVADWMLTSNDTDVDGATINGVGGNLGLASLSLANGAVTIRDNGAAGGSFTYTVANPGPGVGATAVTVSQDTSGALDGTDNAEIIIGNSSNSTINGRGGSDIIVGGGGNDTISAGDGDDTIVWNASGNSTDGRDTVDGGSNGTAGDTFVINGSSAAETYTVYTRADWVALGGSGNNGHTAANSTEIVITRGGTTNNSVIAELRDIEELVINTGGGNDTVNVSGNFDATHLNYNTIHINDADGGDTVDITSLTSDHRIVFNTDASGHVVGDLRPQDVVNGATIDQPAPPASQGGDPVGGGSDDDDDDTAPGSSSDDDAAPGDEAPIAAETGQIGTAGADLMIGDAGADVLFGEGGQDVILGNGGDDTLLGGTGQDLVRGGDGADVIMGGEAADDLFGGADDDMIFGDGGADRIFADEGDDVVEGGTGDDTVYLGDGDDRAIATAEDGNDVCWGGEGNDTLDYSAIVANLTVDLGNGVLQHGTVMSAGSGTDTIFGFENAIGGSGDDTIVASSAVNVMDGGHGQDTFVFRSADDASGDTIKGFEPGDTIDLSGIDADANTAGHQSFVLFTGSVFTAAGQVMVTHENDSDGEHTIVRAHLSADGSSDFTIDLTGHHDLTNSDFRLS